jgi:hypothetical protein
MIWRGKEEQEMLDIREMGTLSKNSEEGERGLIAGPCSTLI